MKLPAALLIDAGNSRIKFGCHDGRSWLTRGVLEQIPDEGLPLPAGFTPSHALVSCVAGAEVAEAIERALRPWRSQIAYECLRASASRCGLACDYDDPSQLGADRWAGAVAAWTRCRSDCLVVSGGTATTIDVVRGNGHFAGGCILPGLGMMLDALASGTAALPHATGHFVMPPRNTHDAITTGCMQAQLGAIERMRHSLAAGAPVLLGGGHAETLAPHINGHVILAPWLVLDGLLALIQESGPLA